LIDISAVQAFHTEQDVRSLAAIAIEHGFIAAHTLPHYLPLLRRLVPMGGVTLVGGPVGFPSGGHATETKVAEARALAAAGGQELDMMMNIGRLKAGDTDYVLREIEAVAVVIRPIPLKVIIEVIHLTEAEIVTASRLVAESGVAFVKTGTGWTGKATTPEQVRLIADAVAGRVQIKASGGIRDLETIRRMMALGATRFGINTGIAVRLLRECAKLPGGGLSLAAG
jgi:deoxyribose-phosphate aldolase